MRLAARSTVIAGALAAVAITAQAASARFDLAPSGAPSGRAQTQPADPRPEAHANPDQQNLRTSETGTPPILPRARASELTAINRARATALSFSPARKATALSYSPSAMARFSSAYTDAYARAVREAAVTAPTVGTPSNGFDYGDAAIGAGITAALALVITAGTLAVRQHRQLRHP